MTTINKLKHSLSMVLSLVFILTCALPVMAGSWGTPSYIQSTWYAMWPDISDDGGTIVFLDTENTYNDKAYELAVKVVEKNNGSWSEPVALANNGIKNDFPIVHTHPVISGDGNTIIYLGCSPANENRMYGIERRSDNSWGEPYIIAAIPTGWFGSYISTDYNGDTLAYICGDGDGWFGGTATLYISEKTNGDWQTAQKVYNGDLTGAASVPSLSTDGRKLAWLQAGSQTEVLTAEKAGTAWTEATVLTQSDENETLASISGDGNTVIFCRNYLEGSTVTGKDFFAIKKINGQWQQAVKLNISLECVVSSEDVPPAVDSSGNRVIYTTYERDGDTISSGHLMITEYQNGSWTTPSALTSSTWLYHSHPKLSPDGKELVFKGDANLMYMHTDSDPPQEPEEERQDPDLGAFTAWETREDVASDKEWTIRFSRELDQTSIDSSRIYVRDWRGTDIPVSLSISEDASEVSVTPGQAYDSKEWYYLYISGDIRSANENTLNQGIRMKFIIQ